MRRAAPGRPGLAGSTAAARLCADGGLTPGPRHRPSRRQAVRSPPACGICGCCATARGRYPGPGHRHRWLRIRTARSRPRSGDSVAAARLWAEQTSTLGPRHRPSRRKMARSPRRSPSFAIAQLITTGKGRPASPDPPSHKQATRRCRCSANAVAACPAACRRRALVSYSVQPSRALQLRGQDRCGS